MRPASVLGKMSPYLFIDQAKPRGIFIISRCKGHIEEEHWFSYRAQSEMTPSLKNDHGSQEVEYEDEWRCAM